MDEKKKIISKIKRIGIDFNSKISDILFERDKKIKSLVKDKDKEDIKKINSSLNIQ
jgi:hypothetical protein